MSFEYFIINVKDFINGNYEAVFVPILRFFFLFLNSFKREKNLVLIRNYFVLTRN